MFGATIMALTLVPVLCTYLLGGKFHSEQSNPVMRLLQAIYRPVLLLALRHRLITVSIALVLFSGAIILATGIGKEFMPPLNEGDVMYMPVTDPAISVDEALRILSKQDEILKFSRNRMERRQGWTRRYFDRSAPVNMNEQLFI